MKLMKKHRPPVLAMEGETTYFISARTYSGLMHLAGDEKKDVFKEILFDKVDKFSGDLNHWVIILNHYHLLMGFKEGNLLPRFIQELHGATSFKIKKVPKAEVLNEEQIVFRKITPMEERTEARIEDLWRKLKLLARTESETDRRLKSAKTSGPVLAGFRINDAVLAGFSPRLKDFSPRLDRVSGEIQKAILTDNLSLFKVIVASNLPDIPFWHNCFNHVIRNEKDYFCHFNYITQNPIKHNLVKNPWEYRFSGVFDYDKEYINDCLRSYPIIDFGGEYD